MILPKILVACPVHSIKRYSLPHWLFAVQRFNPQPFEILWVDNSPTDDIYRDYQLLAPMVRIEFPEGATAHTRIAHCMDFIRRRVIVREFDYLLSLECDVIAPFDTLRVMIDWATQEEARWYPMPCPGRGNDHLFSNNFCCALFPRTALEHIDFRSAPAERCADGWLHRMFIDLGWKIAQNPPRILELKHLSNPDPTQEVRW